MICIAHPQYLLQYICKKIFAGKHSSTSTIYFMHKTTIYIHITLLYIISYTPLSRGSYYFSLFIYTYQRWYSGRHTYPTDRHSHTIGQQLLLYSLSAGSLLENQRDPVYRKVHCIRVVCIIYVQAVNISTASFTTY